MTKLYRLSAAAIMAACIALTAPSPRAAEKVALQLRWHHDFQFAGYYAALWQGYYADAGLDVEIRDAFYRDGKYKRPTTEVAEGRAAFGIAGSDLIPSQEKGVPFTVVASIFQESPLTIYAKAGTPLRSPADLKHLNLGMFMRGNVSDAEVQAMLMMAGLDPKSDFPRVTVTRQRLADLAAGRIDAAVTYTTDLNWNKRKLGVDVVQLKPSSYGVEFYGDSLFARREYVANAPEVVQAFRDASLRGWRYALTNADEIADRIARELMDRRPMPDAASFIRSQIGAVKQLTHYPIVALGSNDLARWRRIYAALTSVGMVSGGRLPDAFVFDPARQERRRLQTMWGVAALAVLLGTVLAILVWIIALRRGVASRTRALAQSEERFAAAVAGTNDGIWDWDLETGKCYRSPRWLQILGYEAGDLGPHPEEFLGHVHPDDRDGLERAIRRHIDDGVPYDLEIRVARKTGEYLWVRTKGQAVWNEDGNPVRLAGALSDISEHKRAEEALLESEEHHRLLIEISPDAVFVHVNNEIVFANPALVTLLGAECADRLVGMSATDLLHPEYRERIFEIRAEMENGTSPFKLPELCFVGLDGREIFVESTATTLRWKGQNAFMIVTRDVTERKRVRDELNLTQYTLDHGADPAYWLGERGNLEYVNIAGQRALGYTRDELAAMHIWDIDPNVIESEWPAIWAKMLTRESNTFETVHHTKDGTDIPVEVTTVQFSFPDRGIVCSYARDISERKRAQQKAAAAHERLEDAIESISEGFILFDAEDRLVLCNRKYRELYPNLDDLLVPGVGLEDLVRESVSRGCFRGIDDQEAFVARRLEANRVASGFQELPLADGRWILAAERRMREGGVVGIRTDITGFKRQQQALRASEERFKAVVDNSPAVIVLHDLESRLLMVNRQFEVIFGCPSEEAYGKSPYELHSKDDADALCAMTQEVIESRGIVDRELETTARDGTVTSRIVTKFPVYGTEGEVVAIGAIATDITERKKVEEALRQAQKMEAIGQLTGGVAHDFNNLLAIILGNAELLHERLDMCGMPADDGSLAKNVIQAATRGGELTQQLLSFARRQKLTPEPIDLAAKITELERLFARTLGETISIRTRFADQLWNVNVDPGQLENALLNLALNARDAMTDGGVIAIEAINTTLTDSGEAIAAELEPGDYVTLSVSDHGGGMPAAALSRAFEPFFTTKDIGTGSGLGLSMVYGFAQQSSGTVSIDSIEGAGTTVKLYLPRATTTAKAAEPLNDVAEDHGNGEIVLLVEDEAGVRTLAATLLDSLGYSVVEASDGRSAVAALDKAERVDLLLSDVVLPGDMSGPMIAEEARRRHEDIKVLFMSGYPDRELLDHGPLKNGGEILGKPFRRGQLAQHLRRALGNGVEAGTA